MGPFLRGFADELIKVAGPDWTSVVRPPTTATGTERTPKPANALGPSNAMLSAIPTQRMESPASSTPQTWRPSPGYKPNPASDPKPAPAPKPTGAARPATPVNAQPAWETSSQMHGRQANESAYNAGRAGGPMPASLQNAPGPGSAPRPLSSTEKAYVSGSRPGGYKPEAPGSLRQPSPLQQSGFGAPATPKPFGAP